MADNDTAALVVALSAQLTRFEKDMKGAVDIADRRTKEIETRFDKMNSAISSKAQMLSSTAIGNLGFVGTLISSIGPAGIVAATGLGVAVAAMFALVNATDAYVEKAKQWKDAAETTNLTITQIKLLAGIGKTVGFDFEETAKFVAKFLQNLEALRHGSGPLYEALLRIDTGLLDQLSVTKDSAKAIELLISAFGRLGDQTKKLDLAKAAGGKGGLEGVRFLEALAKSGGLRALEQNAAPFDEDQVERVVRLRREIDGIKARTANIWGSMWSDNVLQHEKEMADDMNKLAEAVERFVKAKERSARTGNPAGAQADDLVAERERLQEQLKALEAAAASKPVEVARTAQQELMAALEKERGWTKDEIAKIEAPPVVALDQVKKRLQEIDDQLTAIREKFGGTLPSAIKAAIPPAPQPSLRDRREGIAGPAPTEASPPVQLDRLQKNIQLLGDAVTTGEQWRKKTLEIKVAEDAGGIATDTRSRALAAFALTMRAAAIATLERLNIASQQEIIEGKLIALEKDRIKNGLTVTQVERGKAAIMREVNDAANAARERLAIATEQQIVESRLNDLERERLKNNLGDAEVQRAKVVILREAKDAADALTVRQAYLPGLKQLELDARNLRKGLDEVTVGGLNTLADGFTDVIMRTKDLSTAVKDMTTSILRDITRLALRQGIIGPLAGLFGLGAGAGPNPIVPGATNVVGSHGDIPVPTFMAGGGNLQPGDSAYVGEHGPNPRLIKNVGNRPIMVTPNDVSQPSAGAGGNVSVSLHVGDIDARGATAGTSEEIISALERRFLPKAVAAVGLAIKQRRI